MKNHIYIRQTPSINCWFIKYFVNQCHQYYEKIYANNFILRKISILVVKFIVNSFWETELS